MNKSYIEDQLNVPISIIAKTLIFLFSISLITIMLAWLINTDVSAQDPLQMITFIAVFGLMVTYITFEFFEINLKAYVWVVIVHIINSILLLNGVMSSYYLSTIVFVPLYILTIYLKFIKSCFHIQLNKPRRKKCFSNEKKKKPQHPK